MLEKSSIFWQYKNAINIVGIRDEIFELFNKYSLDDFMFWFDVDTASGYQLDDIGALLDFPRPADFVGNDGVWDFSEWDNFTWAGDGTETSGYLLDEQYRKLLKIIIGQNLTPITINSIYQLLDSVFPNNIFEIVETVMNIELKIPPSMGAKDIILLTDSGVLRMPQGVNLQFTIV